MTPESLQIEYNMTGLRNSAATSRMMPIDSASSRRSCADRATRVAVVLILDRSCGQRCDVQGATGNEMRVAQPGLAILQGRAARRQHGTPRRHQYGLAGCGIPLHR